MQTQLCVPPETFALRLWTERIKEEGAQMRSSLNTTLSNTHTLQLCEGRRRHVHPPGSSAPREALNNCLSTITQGPEWRPLPCAFHGSARLGGGGGLQDLVPHTAQARPVVSEGFHSVQVRRCGVVERGGGYPSHEAHLSRARHRGGTGSNPSTPDGATCSRAGIGLSARARGSGHFPPVVAPSVAGLAARPAPPTGLLSASPRRR